MIEILAEYRGTLTAVLVALIGLGGAFALQRYLAIRNAVHTYKSAFAPEIAAVASGRYAIDTFASAFQRHSDAVDNIRPLLPKRDQRKLQKAWDEYRGKDNNLGFDDQGYVSATSATIYTADKALFHDFKKRFTVLHGCLNGFL